jgi:hypothetical protein
MLPSPSLGAPLLSASLSPALGPWGIPDELALEVVVFAGDNFLAVVVAGFELVLGAEVVVAAGEFLVEEDELLPHPAAITAATASAANGSPRASLNLLIMTNLCCLSCGLAGIVKNMTLHAREPSLSIRVVPIRASMASCAHRNDPSALGLDLLHWAGI